MAYRSIPNQVFLSISIIVIYPCLQITLALPASIHRYVFQLYGTEQDLNKMVDMAKFCPPPKKKKRSSWYWKWGAKPQRIPTDSQRGSAPPQPSTPTSAPLTERINTVARHDVLRLLITHLLSTQTTNSWKMLMNYKFQAQSLNRKSYRKFTLSCFSVTCFKHVGLFWPIRALNRKQVSGYMQNMWSDFR